MQAPVEKNKNYTLEIIDYGVNGEGIAKLENFTIFIKGAIIGEIIDALIVKVLSNYAFGKIIKIKKKSNLRKEVDCATYSRCGGCRMRHIDYNETLKIKRNNVQNTLNKMLKVPCKVQNIIGMENPYHYRNKARIPFCTR